MSGRTASDRINWQERAKGFSIGDIVYPFMSGNNKLMGRVVAVYPAIGMVDVEWPHGSERLPVEDLAQHENVHYLPPPVEQEEVPGGVPQLLPVKVAHAWVARTLAKNGGDVGGKCPRCGGGLKKARYEGSQRLMGCPECLYLVKVGNTDTAEVA